MLSTIGRRTYEQLPAKFGRRLDFRSVPSHIKRGCARKILTRERSLNARLRNPVSILSPIPATTKMGNVRTSKHRGLTPRPLARRPARAASLFWPAISATRPFVRVWRNPPTPSCARSLSLLLPYTPGRTRCILQGASSAISTDAAAQRSMRMYYARGGRRRRTATPGSRPRCARRGPGDAIGRKALEERLRLVAALGPVQRGAVRDVHRRLLPSLSVTVLSTDRASTRSRSAADTSLQVPRRRRRTPGPEEERSGPQRRAPAAGGQGRRARLRQRDEGAPALAVHRTAARPGRDGADADAAGGRARGRRRPLKQRGASSVARATASTRTSSGVDSASTLQSPSVAACVEIKFRAPTNATLSARWRGFRAIARCPATATARWRKFTKVRAHSRITALAIPPGRGDRSGDASASPS